jgi:Protein of unknown function (DUF4019)
MSFQEVVMFPRKYRIHAFLILISLIIIFYPQFSRKPDQQRIDDSTIVAMIFLDQVDSGQYDQSWQGAADYLKNQVPLDDWITKLKVVRTAAGKNIERNEEKNFYSKEQMDSLPEGEYMVYIFASKFENQAEVTETVTVMLEKDDIWRVAGYFIE